MLDLAAVSHHVMQWNNQPIPYQTALQIGWNLPQDVVGSGVYGGIVSREKTTGKILIGKKTVIEAYLYSPQKVYMNIYIYKCIYR